MSAGQTHFRRSAARSVLLCAVTLLGTAPADRSSAAAEPARPPHEVPSAPSPSGMSPAGSGCNWTWITQRVAQDGAAGDQFGYSVSISGDTAVVGAYLDDGPGTNLTEITGGTPCNQRG